MLKCRKGTQEAVTMASRKKEKNMFSVYFDEEKFRISLCEIL